ncbi:hypothetical protein ACHMW6_00365 (plasmid) [Pseudoduganella sp. UC29_106]
MPSRAVCAALASTWSEPVRAGVDSDGAALGDVHQLQPVIGL